MNVKETLETLADRLQSTSVRAVYGEPVSAEGKTIIPVARVAFGFGGGGSLSGSTPEGSRDRITRDQTRFLRFVDWRPLAVAGAVGLGLGLMLSRWGSRRPT